MYAAAPKLVAISVFCKPRAKGRPMKNSRAAGPNVRLVRLMSSGRNEWCCGYRRQSLPWGSHAAPQFFADLPTRCACHLRWQGCARWASGGCERACHRCDSLRSFNEDDQQQQQQQQQQQTQQETQEDAKPIQSISMLGLVES